MSLIFRRLTMAVHPEFTTVVGWCDGSGNAVVHPRLAAISAPVMASIAFVCSETPWQGKFLGLAATMKFTKPMDHGPWLLGLDQILAKVEWWIPLERSEFPISGGCVENHQVPVVPVIREGTAQDWDQGLNG